MLAGIPAHFVLLLLGAGTIFGLGGMSVNKLAGILMMGVVALIWITLAFIYGQDRVRVPLMLLRLRYRFARRLHSYSPSDVRIRIEDR